MAKVDVAERLKDLDEVRDKFNNPMDVERVVSLYEDGVAPAKIARIMDRAVETISNALRNRGLSRFDRGGEVARQERQSLREKALDLRDEGLSPKQSARVMDCSDRFVRTLLLEAGLTGDDLLTGEREAWEEERRQAIIDDYLGSDDTLAQVGERHGVSGSRVHQIMKDEGVSAQDRRLMKLTREAGVQLSDLKALYEDELLSCARIADRVGRSESWVRSTLVRMGVQMRGPGARHGLADAERRTQHLEILRLLLLDGCSQREVAEMLECSRSRVKSVFKKFRTGESDITLEEIQATESG